MNTIETNEILEMREQLAALKKRLNTQEIINDRLIKEAMLGKLSTINRRAILLCIIILVSIPYTYFIFGNLGMSKEFCCATILLLSASLVAMILSHFRLRKRDIYSGDLVATYKEVSRMRTIYKRWHYFSIPILVLWFAWFEYDIYTYVAEDTTMLLAITASAIFGAIIGGLFGLRAHNRTLREAEDILKQIEELQA